MQKFLNFLTVLTFLTVLKIIGLGIFGFFWITNENNQQYLIKKITKSALPELPTEKLVPSGVKLPF